MLCLSGTYSQLLDYVLVAVAIAVDLLIFKTGYTFPGLIIVLLGIPVYFIRKRFAEPAPCLQILKVALDGGLKSF